MYCSKCGVELIDGNKFCTNCGLEITTLNIKDIDIKSLDNKKIKKDKNKVKTYFLNSKKKYWIAGGVFLLFLSILNNSPEEETLRVLNCRLQSDFYVSYNTTSGQLYSYDTYREGWVPFKKSIETTTSYGDRKYIKTESRFVDDNLKILERKGRILGRESSSIIKIYQAKKDKDSYKANFSGRIKTCKVLKNLPMTNRNLLRTTYTAGYGGLGIPPRDRYKDAPARLQLGSQ